MRAFATGVEIHQRALARVGTSFAVIRLIDANMHTRSALAGGSFIARHPSDSAARARIALRDFPVDGQPLEIDDRGRVLPVSGHPKAFPRRTREYRSTLLLGPPRDMVERDLPVLGEIAGWGVGVENAGGEWTANPYLAVQIEEFDEEAGKAMKVVTHARLLPPGAPETRIAGEAVFFDDLEGEDGIVPAVFAGLMRSYSIGERVEIRAVFNTALRYYLVRRVIPPKFPTLHPLRELWGG